MGRAAPLTVGGGGGVWFEVLVGAIGEPILEVAVAELHRKLVHAGSHIVEAFTYYAHRKKMRSSARRASWRRSTTRRSSLPGASQATAERCSPAISATRT